MATPASSPQPEMATRKPIKAQTRRGMQLEGGLFANGEETTVIIAITGGQSSFRSRRDFSEVEKIKQTGALIIGTYDILAMG